MMYRNFFVAGCAFFAAAMAYGSENVPYLPFAERALLPAKGQIVAGLIYEESEAYKIWAKREGHDITWEKSGEEYGIDINQGFLTFDYGLTEKWALDLSAGATTMGSRSFSNGKVESTTGLMDISFGVRYQIFREEDAPCRWLPTLTFRAGAVMPGTYEEEIPFAPGVRSAAIEPELLFRKHVGWTGFGIYGDGLFRWNRTSHNDQYITSVGIFQEIKGWELDAGYRHMQSVSGHDIEFNPDAPTQIDYPRAVREIYDAVEAGFSYTTRKHHIKFGFHTRAVLDGTNTDQKFWVGGSVSVPFGGAGES